MVGLLLGIAHADHGNDGTQHNAQHQRNGRDQQGRADALDILLPPVRIQKCLVEFYEEVLAEAQLLAAFSQLRERFKLRLHPQHNLSFWAAPTKRQ